MPPAASPVKPRSPAASPVNPGSTPYIQVGVETGQKSWELHINSPIPDLFAKTHRRFQGPLELIADEVHWEINDIADTGRKHGLSVRVVYEAGCFGQKFGQNLCQLDVRPVQLVARNIEYVRFGNNQFVPKTDTLDAIRQANIPLEDPKLPYADIQTQTEEGYRELLKEKDWLSKQIHQANDRMCAIMRRAHLDTKHCSPQAWEQTLSKEKKKLSNNKQYILNNRLTELKDATEKKQTVEKLILQHIIASSKNWQPPDPAAQPATAGRHPLQALGENSPLRENSLPQTLLQVKGISTQTMVMLVALVGDPRRFKNKKSFRAFLGLAPIPYSSCTMRKSMGMKRGNPKLRKLMIQLAWRWCKQQPDTPLAKKYTLKLAGSRRSKKIAICALAGELAEMLFNHLVHGKEIPGLCLKTP
jgi:hypothetical protein